MAVVKDYMSGNCRVVIYDDCFVKTEEEKQQIFENIKAIYLQNLRDKAIREAAQADTV